MCGIFGWQWKPSSMPSAEKRHTLAALLGMFNDDRGGDSWGWYAPIANKIYHDMGLCQGLARHLAVHPNIIAHTRKATVGEKTLENSHPFVMGKIIGAHNGGVWNHAAQGAKFDVDSQHIFDKLSRDEDLSELNGYGAIEWIDRLHESGRIYLCRISSHADLGVAITPHGIVWSSNKVHLGRSLSVAGIPFNEKSLFELKHETVFFVSRGSLFETEKKLFFGTYQSTTSGSGAGTYGSSICNGNAQSARDRYRENYDRSMGNESGQQNLAIVDDQTGVVKTIGKVKKVKCKICNWYTHHQVWCKYHESNTVTTKDKAPDPRPTAPVSNPTIDPRSTVLCHQCYNQVDGYIGHRPECTVLRLSKELGGGVG